MRRKGMIAAVWAVLFWIVMALAVAILVMACSPARAQSEPTAIMRQGDDWVRLTLKPCRIQSVLQKAPQGQRGYLKMAYARMNGVEYSGCWHLLPNMLVHLIYEDGDEGLLHAVEFEAETGS